MMLLYVRPSLTTLDTTDGHLPDTVTRRDHLLREHPAQRSNLANLILSQLRAGAFCTTSRARRTVRKGVPDVHRARNPLEIFRSVIESLRVDVIRLMPGRRRPVECDVHEAMNAQRSPYTSDAQRDQVIASVVDLGSHDAPVRRRGAEADASHAPHIGHLVVTLVAVDVAPDLTSQGRQPLIDGDTECHLNDALDTQRVRSSVLRESHRSFVRPDHSPDDWMTRGRNTPPYDTAGVALVQVKSGDGPEDAHLPSISHAPLVATQEERHA